MANTDKPNGFRPVGRNPRMTAWISATSQTIAVGDMVYLDSAGKVTIATSSTADVMGVAASSVSSAAAETEILVYDDPMQRFEGQCSGSGALADPYTCVTLTSCFDIEGTTGIMEIDENASTYDIVKVVGVGTDPDTGEDSAVGANQRKVFIINQVHHQLVNPA